MKEGGGISTRLREAEAGIKTELCIILTHLIKLRENTEDSINDFRDL